MGCRWDVSRDRDGDGVIIVVMRDVCVMMGSVRFD